jgi:hypothetical protein
MTDIVCATEMYKGHCICVKAKRDGKFYGVVTNSGRSNKHFKAIDSSSLCLSLCEDWIEDDLDG